MCYKMYISRQYEYRTNLYLILAYNFFLYKQLQLSM